MEGSGPVSIGAVEEATGLTARQIRYYERWGLVEPQRSAGRHRQYSWQDVERLKDVSRRLQAGQSLAAVRQALLGASGAGRPESEGADSPGATDAASHFRGQAWVRRQRTAAAQPPARQWPGRERPRAAERHGEQEE